MLTAKLILERLDKDGKLLERREQQSRSFTKNFIALLYCAHAQILAAAPFTMTDIGGTPRTIDGQGTSGYAYAKSNLMIGAPPGKSGVLCHPGAIINIGPAQLTVEGEKIGIQVGTGTNVVTPTDTALQTRIVHGSSASQLEYGGCEFLSITFSNPNGSFTIRRYFTNNSGGSITVNEVGLHAIGTDQDTRYAWPFLIARDKVDPGVAVLDGEILRVTYVPQITV